MARKMTITGKLTFAVFLCILISVVFLIHKNCGLPGLTGVSWLESSAPSSKINDLGWNRDAESFLVEGNGFFYDFAWGTVWKFDPFVKGLRKRSVAPINARPLVEWAPLPESYCRYFPGSMLFSNSSDGPTGTIYGYVQMNRVPADFGLWIVPSQSGVIRNETVCHRLEKYRLLTTPGDSPSGDDVTIRESNNVRRKLPKALRGFPDERVMFFPFEAFGTFELEQGVTYIAIDRDGVALKFVITDYDPKRQQYQVTYRLLQRTGSIQYLPPHESSMHWKTPPIEDQNLSLPPRVFVLTQVFDHPQGRFYMFRALESHTSIMTISVNDPVLPSDLTEESDIGEMFIMYFKSIAGYGKLVRVTR